jgi:hypothetical protein
MIHSYADSHFLSHCSSQRLRGCTTQDLKDSNLGFEGLHKPVAHFDCDERVYPVDMQRLGYIK